MRGSKSNLLIMWFSFHLPHARLDSLSMTVSCYSKPQMKISTIDDGQSIESHGLSTKGCLCIGLASIVFNKSIVAIVSLDYNRDPGFGAVAIVGLHKYSHFPLSNLGRLGVFSSIVFNQLSLTHSNQKNASRNLPNVRKSTEKESK